ncbi:MAG: TonB-dependent receptor [Terriglobia bacterium]
MWLAPVASLFAAALIPVCALDAASPIHLAGELSGLVTDHGGRPQPGALVLLFNRQEQLLQRLSTDNGGTFSFGDLLPDLYSIRVTLASFLPASRDRVQVKPGMRSLLEVNLSHIFSSVQLVSTVPATGSLMNDNWKWALREDSSLRPILRLLPAIDDPLQRLHGYEKTAVFTGSRGLVRISASDGSLMNSDTGAGDLGTQFAFATSVYGDNHVRVSGNLGYGAASGAPAAAFRTTYSRDFLGAAPAVSVTMHQMFVPARVGQSLTGSAPGDSALPALRSIAVSFSDKTQLTDSITAEYGMELDNVTFLDHLHYVSPYGKLTWQLAHGKADFTYTSGNARPELGIGPSERNADLQRDLAALALVPRVTLGDGHARVQRGESYELGLSQRFGSREYRVEAYRQAVKNLALMVANPDAAGFEEDLLPDAFSNSALFNAGRFQSAGYTASVTQDLGDNYRVTVIYGTAGMLAARAGLSPIASAGDLRHALEAEQRPALTVRTSGTVKASGTRFIASYQWTNYTRSMPAPLFSTQSSRPEPGLNFVVKQPMPWRMEMTAELRNLLAQGYLPIASTGGSPLLLVNTPRSLRGGLAFVF